MTGIDGSIISRSLKSNNECDMLLSDLSSMGLSPVSIALPGAVDFSTLGGTKTAPTPRGDTKLFAGAARQFVDAGCDPRDVILLANVDAAQSSKARSTIVVSVSCPHW